MPRQATPMPSDAAALLGAETDAEVAARFGVEHHIARAWRVRAGIPAVGHRPAPPPCDAGEVLGKVTDREAAAHYGKDVATIYRWRRALRIPPSDPRGARATHVAPPAQRRDIVDAARTLLDAARPVPGGMLVSFEHFAALHRLAYPTAE